MYHSNRNIYQTSSSEFEVGNGKITGIRQIPQYLSVGHSDGRLGKQVTAFGRHTKTLVGKFGKITNLPIQKSEEFEVGNGKYYQHPPKFPAFFSRSVNILVRMACTHCVRKRGLQCQMLIALAPASRQYCVGSARPLQLDGMKMHFNIPRGFCDLNSTKQFRAWLVRAVFRVNSEQIPSEPRVPSKFRANSEQASQTSFSLSFCATNLLGWLTTGNTLALGVKPTMRGSQQTALNPLKMCNTREHAPKSCEDNAQ